MKIDERRFGDTLDNIGEEKVIAWLEDLMSQKSFRGQRAYIQFVNDKTDSLFKKSAKSKGYKVIELVGQSVSLGADREELKRHQDYINSDSYKGGEAKFRSAEGALREIIDYRGANLLRQNVGASSRVYYVLSPEYDGDFKAVDKSGLASWLKSIEDNDPGSLASGGLVAIGAKETAPNTYAQNGGLLPLRLSKLTYINIGGKTIGQLDNDIPHRSHK